MNPDPEHQRRLKKAAEMMVENQVKMIRMIMVKAAMGIIEGGMEAVQEAEQKPTKREWVGLTEDEVDDIWNKYCDEMGEASINDAEDIAKAIEAKLKEKNT